MSNWKVLVTRDCRLTQSGVVFVEADTRDEAEEKALDIPQENIEWSDDDSFVAGEDGTYVADAGAIVGLPTTFDVPRAAIDFSSILRSWLTVNEMSIVIANNKDEELFGICHSGDFCDSNMAMDEAWGRQGIRPLETERISDTETTMSDDMVNAWNAAWDLAKLHDFDPVRIHDATKEQA